MTIISSWAVVIVFLVLPQSVAFSSKTRTDLKMAANSWVSNRTEALITYGEIGSGTFRQWTIWRVYFVGIINGVHVEICAEVSKLLTRILVLGISQPCRIWEACLSWPLLLIQTYRNGMSHLQRI